MNFSKIEVFPILRLFFSLVRPILLAAFNKAGNFTWQMYFLIFFGTFGAWCIKIKQTVQQRSEKYGKLEKFIEAPLQLFRAEILRNFTSFCISIEYAEEYACNFSANTEYWFCKLVIFDAELPYSNVCKSNFKTQFVGSQKEL